MADQADQEQNQENEVQKLRNASGCKSNGSEAEQPGNYRNDEKNQRIIKHRASLSEALNWQWNRAPSHFPAYQS
jgi:hypothetical protein